MDTQPGHFYLGATLEDGQPVAYNSENLTTHGVIVGMTGSGKTGLGVGMIEEALLNQVPCLIIDPKGDMGNLALNFPDFDPEDFRPWIDEAAARVEGKTAEEVAASTASLWKDGLHRAGISPDRMRELKDGAEVIIYTPGSTAGVPLNVVGSLKAPETDWAANAEVIRDEIESFVSSLLIMADVDADPISSPSHILLSTIIEKFWSEGRDLDLATLIGQVPKPPTRKLGVFDVDEFFPQTDRMELAMKLNGLLASPSFSSWLEGVPLDIGSMLGGGQRTRAAVVYLAHLSESERQFVVTLLLSKFVTWMRAQSGSSTLRALIYMDEVFGFAPPTAEPPSKKPILTILKQARAYGCGMVLSTQNPVDLDYKAISNAGTWLVGRLQTENDKRRILEGLDSAGASVDLKTYDKLISGLDKRQFLLHSTKQDPVIFSTRWVVSYLAGPLTREQVSILMEDSNQRVAAVIPTTSAAPPLSEDAIGESVPVMPGVADGFASAYLDPAAGWAERVGADPAGTHYEAAVAVTVNLLYDDAKAGVNHAEGFEAVIFPVDEVLTPEVVTVVDHDSRDFLEAPTLGTVEFRLPGVKIQNKGFWTSLSTQLKNYLVANQTVNVQANTSLGLYSRVGESDEDFHARCDAAAEDAADAALAKLRDKYKARIDRAQATIAKSENRVRELEAEASSKGQEELLTGAGDLLGALFGGKSRSNPLGQAARRRSATSKAKARAEAAGEKMSDEMAALDELEDELADEITRVTTEFAEKARDTTNLEIPLEKTDITVSDLKLVWIPRSR